LAAGATDVAYWWIEFKEEGSERQTINVAPKRPVNGVRSVTQGRKKIEEKKGKGDSGD